MMENHYHKCRLCLKLGDFTSIFEQDDTIKLSDMVMSFANLQIYEGDGFPSHVCTTCIENFSTAYLFKQQCERIDTFLRKCPDDNLTQPLNSDCRDLFNQEFHIHTIYESFESDKSDNDENNFKSAIEENTFDRNANQEEYSFKSSNEDHSLKSANGNHFFKSANGGNLSFKSANGGDNSFKSANGGDSSFKSANGDHSFKSANGGNLSLKIANGGDHSFKSANGGDSSFKSANGDHSFKSAHGGNLSFKSANGGDNSFKSANSGDSSFKSAHGGDHSFKSANGDDYFFKSATDGSSYELSDGTDSEVDSVKCACCNQPYSTHGTHTCHVACTIEHNYLQRSSSNETLMASDATPPVARKQPPLRPPSALSNKIEDIKVSCVLCDEDYTVYDDYVNHVNKCTTNVKLHHFVCPVCHDIYTEKTTYFEHLKVMHFKCDFSDPGIDCVDFAPKFEKTRRPKAVRRQIGWSVEDIYQEIDCKPIDDKQIPTSSPIKNFFSKFGNENVSRQSTPKKVSFRKLLETGKAKTSNYLPFQKYIQNYKLKKKLNAYSPIKEKIQVSSKIQACLPDAISDSDYGSPSGTSEESWKLKQNLICACDKKVFMLSEYIGDKERITAMINELGGVVAENTKMEMLATHFVSVLPKDTMSGMMVCALATGKWLLTINFIYDSFRCKKFLQEYLYEWMKHPKILEIDTTSVEVARAATYWHTELEPPNARFPFEGKQVVLIMKKKYRQYYQMIFKALKAKPVTYDPRTPGSCCTADYCFVDMKVIERVKLRFFAHHNVPVFPYQYILVYLLKRGQVEDEHKYLLQDCKAYPKDTNYLLNNTY